MARLSRVSRRTLLRAGIGVAVGSGLAGTATAVFANSGSDSGIPGATLATKIANLSGPDETGPFGAAWSDLGIPARCPDGTMLFVGGDTWDGSGVGDGDWRAPVALRSGNADPNGIHIDGAVGGAHAVGLVGEDHHWVHDDKYTTAIPSDVFTVGDTMYMHLMRGVIYETHHSDFWRSTDNGETWEYLCQWPGDLYGGQFQQKTYAVADDGYCYVLSTVFNRDIASGLLLHRVRQDQLGNPDAYEPWGYDGGWNWGNAPTTINGTRRWGEICFRAMGGKYAFTWFQPDPNSIRAQVFPVPTADLTATQEQVLILPAPRPDAQVANLVSNPYGGFIVPGSSFDDFHIVVSQWYDPQNYRFMHYRINGLAH